MTFKWTIECPPLRGEFETGSITEAVSIIAENESALAKLFGAAKSAAIGDDGSDSDNGGEETSAETGTTTTASTGGKRRGRPAKNRGPDPATASAPAPMPTPDTAAAAAPPAPPPPPMVAAPVGAAAPPPPPLVGNDPGPIPPALDRTKTAAPPPPPLPAAPPTVPTPPVPSALALAFVAELKRRAAGNEATGKELAAWLAQPTVGLVVPDATFDEACSLVEFMNDDTKLRPIAAMFGVNA